ncbi:hypothetical protein JMJ56_28080 [Belnapia sp. T18]|uniref:Uncharacterized protein n=1 Tax=Belnapia arida TaxID=2804533 RepID=A0ABS1UAZ3_9PROT|nr:hypothetical protein [Belnapia arida]MBL6081848.1 hypothetical protein [Belnapia arida]
MADNSDDLGDARSRTENQAFRDKATRASAGNPEMAYMPRWVPMGNWRMSSFDLVVVLVGVGLIIMVLGMRLLGVIGEGAG